jgi:cytochrome c oxidase assembly factor CtaG
MERPERYLTNQLKQRCTTLLVEVSLIRSGFIVYWHLIDLIQGSHDIVYEIQMDAGSNVCEFHESCH